MKYTSLKKISTQKTYEYHDAKPQDYFEEYKEKYVKDIVIFEGKLKEKKVKVDDQTLFKAIDGAMRYKKREIKRDGRKVKGRIYHYSVEEIRKMIERDKYGK